MCIYPEGTRNRTKEPLGEFRDGAFRLAKDTGVNIIPALIFNTKKVLPTDRKFMFRPGKMELHFLPEINSGNFESYNELKSFVHQTMSDYFVAQQKKKN